MKKFTTMMLGLSLVLGTATFAFADDTQTTTKQNKKAKKAKSVKKTTPATEDKK